MNRIAIYDMDGTIVCSMHRYRTIVGDNGERIDLDYWRENEYRAMDDSLLPLADNYKKDIADRNCFVVIATARILRTADLAFIADKLGNPDFIVSRPEHETISGGTLKIRGLQKVFQMFPNIKRDACVFYEDNIQYLKAVCDYYNIRGVYVPSKQGH